MDWVLACKEVDVGDGQIISFDHGGSKLMLARVGGKIRAAARTCTHADADLSTGFVSEEGVRCPLHLSVFCMENGAPQNPPAEAPLAVYNVKIQDGGVYVEV